MVKGYRSYSIPESLVDRAKRLVEGDVGGYRTVSELIIDAVRRRIEELESEERIRKAAEMGNLKRERKP